MNKYQVFELKWIGNGPVIADDADLEVPAQIGVLYFGYRIFGYTDREDWPYRRPETSLLDAFAYCKQSCTMRGNRRYAIGRYEQGKELMERTT